MGNENSRATSHKDDDNQNALEVARDDANEKKNATTYADQKPSFRVELTLLDVAERVGNDKEATELKKSLKDEIWKSACSSESLLTNNSSSSSPSRRLSKTKQQQQESVAVVDLPAKIWRFLQVRDKYLATASALFKSQAFHDVYNERVMNELGFSNSSKTSNNSPASKLRPKRINNNVKPVVDLPRTHYRKPYIPLPSKWKTNDASVVQEDDIFSLSVSHQFPFCGLARIVQQHDRCQNKDDDVPHIRYHLEHESLFPIVGLDIVVFDPINKKLYANEDEFLESFQDMFSPDDWTHGIVDNPECYSPQLRMREFYVRWAMKEAYTKAIGVGMGLAFHSFEIHLQETYEEDGEISSVGSSASIYKRIQRAHDNAAASNNNQHTIVGFLGTVVFANEKEAEYFYFCFVPLSTTKSAASDLSSSEEGVTASLNGCACVCVGSSPDFETPDDDKGWKSLLKITTTSLEDLVQSHKA